MKPDDYQAFTEAIVEALSNDQRVLGVIALGSTARADRRDEWSDHDLWLVTVDGAAEALRSDVSWLPNVEHIAIHFAETEHGRSAVYNDGHLIEYAVFDQHELEITRTNAFAVLLDRADIASRMSAIEQTTTQESVEIDADGHDRLGAFAAQVTIGLTRYGRGERLSASAMIRGAAVRSLLGLLAARDGLASPLDSLDPHRRFEQHDPVLAAEILDAIEASLLDLVDDLLSIAERELSSYLPAMDRVLGALRNTLARSVERTVRPEGST